jgi:dipeptidyl aminopeptidase/acylaminoacyl peptidase
MTDKTIRQYGLWTSPITPRNLAEGLRLDGVAYDGDGRTLVWLEGRSGRGVLVAQAGSSDVPRDLTAELSVRAEVGYGGGDFTVGGGSVYFAVHKSGHVYRQPLSDGQPRPLTPAFGSAASPTLSPDGRWLAYVHHDDGIDRLAAVEAGGSAWPQILTEGHDFYMQPRFSPDGRRMAWIAWDHPNMPWDGTLLYVAEIDASAGLRLENVRTVAGGDEVAAFQPEFTPDGRRLLFVSDESGWGQIHVHDLESGRSEEITSEEAEFGQPGWVQDMRTYAVAPDGRRLTAVMNRRGFRRLVRIDLASGAITPVESLEEYADVAYLVAAPQGDRVAMVASGPAIPPRVVEHDFTTGRTRIVARSSGETVLPSALARIEAVSWQTAGGETAHGLYWPPASERFESPGKPPLVALIHGGPTSETTAAWKADAQFFATRGYAVLAVNYRGSTGYGRPYMLKLRGNWGVCDVEDAVSGARCLAETGRADPERMVIMGGSAGGFTVLQTLVDQPEAFTAGVCLYGVADQFHLAAQTHKFEARYLDSLLGPLPQAAGLYRQRSPVRHADRIRRPVAIFQGGKDQVVPPAQAEAIVEALRRTGTPHLYHVYPGEGHGWRQRETIEHFYRTAEEFLRKHVLFA